MAAPTIKCAKLGQDLPGIDPDSDDGERALKMVLLIGGTELMERVKQSVSQQAMGMWNDHMLMLLNEFRLDATSDEANNVLRPQMEAFFFGEQIEVPNYVPPEKAT